LSVKENEIHPQSLNVEESQFENEVYPQSLIPKYAVSPHFRIPPPMYSGSNSLYTLGPIPLIERGSDSWSHISQRKGE